MWKSRLGLTLVELLVATVLLGVAIAILVFAMQGTKRVREQSLRIRCRANLCQVAKGMATYLNEYGDNVYYPWPAGMPGCGGDGPNADFGGAEWLAALYWTKIIPDPGCFLCPSSPDDYMNGRDLGAFGCAGPGFQPGPDGKLKPGAVSFAALGATSNAAYQRIRLGKSPTSNSPIRDDFPPNEPMACDDTEGIINHGPHYRDPGMNVLFFDSHVEFWPRSKVDFERGVGMAGTDLFYLRN